MADKQRQGAEMRLLHKLGVCVAGAAVALGVAATPALATGPVSASAATDRNANSTAAAAMPTSISTPGNGWRFAKRNGSNSAESRGYFTFLEIGPGEASCPAEKFCMWTGLNYIGRGLAIGGIWDRCAGVNFQGTIWENRAFSVKNNATGGVSIWNRRTGGGLHYAWLYDLVPGAYSGDFPAGRQADLMVYDPSYTCNIP